MSLNSGNAAVQKSTGTTWTTINTPAQAMSDVAAAVLNNVLYVVDGSYVHAYDPTNNTWSDKAPLNTARLQPEPVAIGNLIYVAGNGASGQSASLEAFAGDEASWSSSDTTIATIDQSGKASALKVGSSTITATSLIVASVSGNTLMTVGPVTVTPSITADDKDYDGTATATIHCALSGVLPADTGNVTCSGTGSFADANAGPGKTVTSNNIALGGSASGNYTLGANTTATTTAKINPKLVTATITASNKNYDGNNTATITSCTIPGKVGSDDVACTASGAVFASANASASPQNVTATVALSGAAAGNYTLGANTTATTMATINAAPLTITANDKSKTYGGTDPSFDVSYVGFVNSENASVLAGTAVFNFAGKPPTNYGPSTTVPTNAGIYAVRPSGLTSSNYAITFKGGTYTINQATPTIAVSFTPSTVTYDGNGHAAAATVTGVNSTTLGASDGTVTISYKKNAMTFVGTPTDAASYTASAHFASTNGNYTDADSTVDAALAINKADAHISVTPYGVNYDGNPHTAAGSATGVEAPTPTNLIGLLDLSGTTHTDAGTYTDTWTFAGNTNYNFASSTVTDSIAKADPVVTATGGILFVYNGNAQAGSGTATGVKSEPLAPVTVAYTVVAAPPRNPGDLLASAPVNAGSYQVAARFAGNNNYNQKQSAAVALVINQAPLTITASSGSMIYGGPVFPVSASYLGFVTGEGPSNLTPQPTCGTSATSLSPVGTYPSACIGAVDSNYSFNYVPGIVTVNPAVTTTTVASSPNPSDWSQVVTLTATVSNTNSTGPAPTGSVSFYNAPSGANCQSVLPSALLGAVGLTTVDNMQQASTSTPNLPVGPGNTVGMDNILACFNSNIADPNFNPNPNFIPSNATVIQTVNPAPIVTLVPTSLSFGGQQGGTSSSAQSITVCNGPSAGTCANAPQSTKALTIAGIAFASPNTSVPYFSETTTCPVSPNTLAYGSSCTISVKFAPPTGAQGIATALLTLTDDNVNIPGSVQWASLIGAGTSVAPGVGSLSNYAIFATANGCSSLNMSGNATVDSFNSGASNNNGNVGTNGNATFNGNTVVNGAVYSPVGGTGNCSSKSLTGLSTSGKAQTGGLQALSGPVTYPAPSVPNPPPTTTQNIAGSCGTMSGCGNSGSKSVTLAPGQYGNLSVSGGTTVHVTMGTYNLNSLTLSGNSTLMVDSGPVVVNIAGKSITGGNAALDLSGGVMLNASGMASNLQFYYAGFQPIKLSGGTGSYAVVYAPNAPINVSGGSHFYGNMIGSTVNNSGGTAIHYDASLPSIREGNYIWFSSAALNVKNLPSNTNVKLYVTNASISFSSTSTQCTGTFSSGQCTLPVPNAVISFSPTATSASTTWDDTNKRWSTIVPTSSVNNVASIHTFFDGVAIPVPSGGLPTGIQNVTWQAAYSTTYTGTAGNSLSFNWQWGAAIYSSLPATGATGNYSPFSVNPLDSSDPAGTPEGFRSNLVFGDMGTGYTGLYSSPVGVVPTIAPMSVSPSSYDFGAVPQNMGLPPVTFNLMNNDTVPYTINSIQMTGTNASDFALQPGGCVGMSSLAASASCNITVVFTPRAASGVKETAKIVVNDNANNSPQTVFLKGTVQ